MYVCMNLWKRINFAKNSTEYFVRKGMIETNVILPQVIDDYVKERNHMSQL